MQQFRGPYGSVIIAALTCACKTFFLDNYINFSNCTECTEWGSVHLALLKICQSIEVY